MNFDTDPGVVPGKAYVTYGVPTAEVTLHLNPMSYTFVVPPGTKPGDILNFGVFQVQFL